MSSDPGEHHRIRAEQAELRLHEIRKKAKTSLTYQREYDEQLAEFYFHNRLHGRTFLDGGPRQRAELESMKTLMFPAADAYDRDRFHGYYLLRIDGMLASLPPDTENKRP